MKLLLAYDGSNYFGWQKTQMGPSIEGAVQGALEQILQEPISLDVVSRTDRGVHARGQIATFQTKKNIDLGKLQYALNGLLPKDIRVLDLTDQNDIQPKWKEYSYRICNEPIQLPMHRHLSWHIPNSLNLSTMRDASRKLLGMKDFSAFVTTSEEVVKNPIRTINAIDIEPWEHGYLFKIRGESFFYKLVRTIVGTLVDVGREKLSNEQFDAICKRADAGVTAPAHGLTLEKIHDLKK